MNAKLKIVLLSVLVLALLSIILFVIYALNFISNFGQIFAPDCKVYDNETSGVIKIEKMTCTPYNGASYLAFDLFVHKNKIAHSRRFKDTNNVIYLNQNKDSFYLNKNLKTLTIVPSITSKYNDLEKEFPLMDNTFDEFYSKFISDTTYQKKHITNSFEGTYSGLDTTYKWTPENWINMYWDFRDELYTNEFDVKIIQDSESLYYERRCKGCGFSFEMKFRKENNKWQITYRQENNY